MTRIYLSPPDVGARERESVLRALDEGWVSTVGPDLQAFEAEGAARAGRRFAVALSSGTAALHLALLTLGVGPGDEVLVPTLTFVATANAVRYVGAEPRFLDSETRSWNVDPDLLAEELAARARAGRRPAAVMAVDLYGQCADYDRIVACCEEHGVPLLEDAAEALGASCGARPAGAFGVAAAFSFNGNKIITTSGGGMLVTDDEAFAARVRHLATQAREPVLHYEHVEVGYNARLSNVLAALGRAQLAGLDARIARRAEIQARYRAALGDLPGVAFLPAAPWGTSNHWLTCLTLDPDAAGADRDALIAALDADDIEARPTWKPMHRQPLYAGAPARLTGVADHVFDTGVCLPTGSALAPGDQDRVVAIARRVLGA